MRLVEQWNTIEKGLDPRWQDARIVLVVDDESRLKRASALLGPSAPVTHGREIRFYVTRGGGVGPEAVRRLLRRLDGEGIAGSLELSSVGETAPAPVIHPDSLADKWTAALDLLPTDWSDLLCELDLTSTDHIEPGALRLAPLNPLQSTGRPGFRFRVARNFGYGAAPSMVHRCFERLDEEKIGGDLRILRVMADTYPVGTQGPVWYIDGRQT